MISVKDVQKMSTPKCTFLDKNSDYSLQKSRNRVQLVVKTDAQVLSIDEMTIVGSLCQK